MMECLPLFIGKISMKRRHISYILVLNVALLLLAAPAPEAAGLSVLRAGERHFAAGENTAAERAYHEAWSLLPRSPEPALRLVALYRDWGRPQEGLAALDAALRQGGDPAELAEQRLALLAALEEWGQLEDAARLRLQVTPEAPQVWDFLTTSLLQQGKCDAARTAAMEWHASAPEDATAQRVWSSLATTMENDLQLGQRLLRQRQWGLAACVLERAVAADPTSAEAQAWLGEALDRLERPAESLPHLEQATVLAPDAPLGWLLLGMHRLRAGDTQVAREALLQAQRLDAGNPAPCLGMAAVLAAESRYTEVGRWTEAALERAPEDVEVWKAVARFYLERNLDLEKGALPVAEGATRLAPTDAEAWMLLGWARLLAQDARQALAALDAATRLDDSLARAHHLRGLALRALGREAEARQALTRAEDLGYRERLSVGERQ